MRRFTFLNIFSHDNGKDPTNSAFVSKGRPHYSSALYTCYQHQMGTLNNRALPSELHFAAKRKNTLISRELALVSIYPGQTTAVSPADLMGKWVYPGVMAQRNGGAMPEVGGKNPHTNTHWLHD